MFRKKLVSVSSPVSSKWDYHLKKAEDLIISVGKWPINSSKLCGLLPFNFIEPGPPDNFKGLERAKLIRVELYSFFRICWLTVGTICCMYGAAVGYHSFMRYGDFMPNKNKALSLFSNEGERFMYTYNGILMVSLGLSVRLLMEWFSESIFTFWHSFLHLFAAFQRLGYLSSGTRVFRKMHLHIKVLTVVCGVVAMLQTFVMVFLHVKFQHKIPRPNHFKSVVVYMTLNEILWFGCVVLVHSNIVVLGMFGFILFVLSACFRVISQELTNINLSVGRKQLLRYESKDTCRALQEQEKAFSLDKGEGNEGKVNLSDAQSKILTLMELYDEATDLIRHFNRTFAVPIILEVLSCLSNSIGFVYSLNKLMYEVEANSLENVEEILTRLPSYLLLTVRLLVLIGICSSVAQEAEAAIKVLHKTPTQIVATSPPLQIKIHMLVTREAANPAVISPGNFFPVNKTFCASILSLLGTYYFVLSGFREEGEIWNLIRNKTITHRHHN